MKTFVCFATSNMAAARDQIVSDARRLDVFQRIEIWDEDRLSSSSDYASLSPRLKQGRGHGFFWWKPYIIRNALEGGAPGDLVFYSDCGRYRGGFRLGDGVKYLMDRYRDTGFAGVEVPQFGPARRWTRKSCLSLSNGSYSAWGDLPQIQATFCLWRKDSQSLSLLKEWEGACRDPELVADPAVDDIALENADFREHRHDQSIVTILARTRGGAYIHTNNFVRSIFMPLLARAEVANVCMKQTEFVAECIRQKRFIRPLVFKYFRGKLAASG